MQSQKQENSTYLTISMITIGIVLNMALGTIVSFTKLPIFVDSIGTIFITLVLGWRAGAIVGVSSFALLSIVVNPVFIYFVGTQLVIATYVYFIAYKLKALRNIWFLVAAGIGLGVVAAVASAPVIVYVFGGVAGSGRDLITAVLMNSGTQVVKAVLLSGAASEPIDKTIQLILACLLVRNAPNIMLSRLSTSAVLQNNFFRKG